MTYEVHVIQNEMDTSTVKKHITEVLEIIPKCI